MKVFPNNEPAFPMQLAVEMKSLPLTDPSLWYVCDLSSAFPNGVNFSGFFVGSRVPLGDDVSSRDVDGLKKIVEKL